MTKIETLGSQVFSVPNTEEGRLFVRLCHKYLNNIHYGISKKTRAKNRKEKYQKMVDAGIIRYISRFIQSDAPPMPYCDWVAIYFPKHADCVIKSRIKNIKNKRKQKRCDG